MSGAIARTYEDKFGISMPEWRIMMILAEYPDSAAEAVCQRTRIEKSVVSRALSRLTKRRLVDRKTDPADRRRSVLRLTETGMSVYADVLPVAIDYEQQFLAALSDEEITRLNQLIEKLMAVSHGMEKP